MTRDDVSRAVVCPVKTDASFGYGKPKFKVCGGTFTETSKTFDVVQLIRNTMLDLSYSHPKLNRRRLSIAEKHFQEPDVDEGPVSPTLDTFSIDGEEDDIILEPVIAETTPIKQSEKLVVKESVVLPALYSHQGYKPTKRDFSKQDQHSIDTRRIEIKEAGKYNYIRSGQKYYP